MYRLTLKHAASGPHYARQMHICGLKHAASGPHYARQMHICGPLLSRKLTKLLIFDQIQLNLIGFSNCLARRRFYPLNCGPLRIIF
jgi:hypothetical protein